MTPFSFEDTLDIEFNGMLYTATYQAEGKCEYTPAALGGLPEDCYPEENHAELGEIIVVGATDWEDQEVTDPGLLAILASTIDRKKVEELLLEKFLQSEASDDDGDFEPEDEDEDTDD
jgi:hypothetical protein